MGKNKRVLIVSRQDDTHAHAIFWGLTERNVQPSLWYWSDFPIKSTSSFCISKEHEIKFNFNAESGDFNGVFDVIWVRRKGAPTPKKQAHPDDVKVIEGESTDYLENILPYLGHDNTVWVNDISSGYRSRNKVKQLTIAKLLGFNIPDTIVGNDYEEIKEFFYRKNQKVIVKSFAFSQWDNANGSRTISRTSRLTSDHFVERYPIEGCPAIYQELIEKKFELRITVMGEHVVSAAIDSQRDGPTIDWRCEGGRGLSNLFSYKINADLEKRCLQLCSEMGIAFGCIDIVVDKNNEYVFLEVNSMGQFLWKEEVDPTILMLEHFCNFILGNGSGELKPLRLSDFFKSEYCSKIAYECC